MTDRDCRTVSCRAAGAGVAMLLAVKVMQVLKTEEAHPFEPVDVYDSLWGSLGKFGAAGPDGVPSLQWCREKWSIGTGRRMVLSDEDASRIGLRFVRAVRTHTESPAEALYALVALAVDLLTPPAAYVLVDWMRAHPDKVETTPPTYGEVHSVLLGSS